MMVEEWKNLRCADCGEILATAGVGEPLVHNAAHVCPSPPAEPIDFRSLLQRYMAHVTECEGVDFLSKVNSEYRNASVFTEAEVEVLRAISESNR